MELTFIQQLTLGVLGPLTGGILGYGASWLTSRREIARQKEAWERERELERQRQENVSQELFEANLADLLVPFNRLVNALHQVIFDFGNAPPGQPLELSDSLRDRLIAYDREVEKILVRIEVTSRDKETLELAEDASRSRFEFLAVLDRETRGDLERNGELLMAWQMYTSSVAEFELLNRRRKVPEDIEPA